MDALELLRAAVAAPSMHNTQPWRLRVTAGGTGIVMFADPDRMLPVGDPLGRAMYIACGAALFNLRMAAAQAGLDARVQLRPETPTTETPTTETSAAETSAAETSRTLFVAEVELSAGHLTAPWERALGAAIPRRHTNREPYGRTLVPQAIRAELTAAASAEGAVLRFLDDNEADRVRRLAADAERELLATPAYRAELARWVGKDRDVDGIPTSTLGPRSATGRDPVRDFAPDRREPVRYADFEEVPQLSVLSVRMPGASPPRPRDWIAAGQALERVWLTATVRDVSLCPLTQALEVADAWLVPDIRRGLEHPAMIMRLGYGPPVRATTPRRAADKV